MGQRNGLRARAARAPRARVIAARFGRALTAMVLALGFLAVGMPATPAAAVQATGGTARFPSIEWFSWGADGATIPNAGITRTENYTLAGQPFNITCTLSNINRTVGTGTGSYLESYRSGTWQGDGFDSLYNIGGVDAANTMVVGLSNHTQGNTITVDFSCSATLAGNAFPLAGLVMADAEASGGSEYVGATIPTSATWRILDRVRGANCNLDTYARRTVVGAANRLELYGPANNTCENGAADVRPGPSSVAFMDGSSSATNVTIAGSGKSAIALGVAFNTDFGDAPASYGNAGAALQYSYTGGDVPVTPSTDTLAANRGTPVFGNITLATNIQPSPRLGTSVDPEATQLYSANATGDDVDGEPASGGPDDENGITISNPVEVAPGTNLNVGPIACTGTGYIGGWIDWNLNGVFDTGEKSTNSPACASNTATLTFAVPSTILPSGGSLNSFLRIRFAPTAAQLTPTGITTGGEVEDYRFIAGAKARVILRKTTLGGFGGPYGFTLTNTTQLTGTATTTTAGTAVQIDGNTAATGTDPFVVTNTGSAVTINESSIPTGWALSSVTCNDGTANVGSLSGTTFTLPGSATGPGSIVTCDFRNGKPSVGLTKVAGALSGNTAGSTIPYTFTVTNTGQTPLSAIAITDPKVTGLTCAATTLAIGASTTCTASHTLTQAEVDAGTVVNNASVTATPPSGPVVTNTATATVTVPRAPSVSLTKTAGTPSGNTAGSTVAYSFLVTNTGNLTLTGVAVTDPTVGAVSCPVTTLAPGASTTCTKTYTLTQADVNAGAVNNTATAAGTPPTGAAVTATSTANRTITRTATMSLDKQAGTPTGSTAGSTIAYTFIVTNTGNVTLTGVAVTDAKVGAISCPQTTLAPGAATTCTKAYVITQADVDAGVVNNTATVTGTPPTGVTAPTATDNTSSTLTRITTITLDKQFSGLTDLDGNGQDAGDRLNYTFLVTNTGNVTLTAVGVTDAKVTNLTCPSTTLAPGTSTTCTGSYLLTQADVDAGHLSNTASATGTPPTGLTRPTATDSTDTPVTPGPAISLDKTAGAPSGSTAGATIAYSFLVTNSGNVTLTSVGVIDPTVGAITCPATTLAPGAATTCTKTYTLTQADVDAGTVINTATASGTSPAATNVSATDSVTSTIARTTALTMDKQAGTLSGTTAGSTLPYSFIVTNTGNVTVTALSVTDPKAAGLTCPVTTLAPGASTTCTATHALTQAEVDAGHVANTASVTATPPSGLTKPTASDSTDTTIAQTTGITLDKQAGTPTGVTPGSTIAYSFIVTNTGNVTLTSVGISDAKVTAVSCPVTTLAPGAATTCVASYPITQADLDAGVVNNTATATGTPPGTMAKPTASDSTTTPLAAAPALTLDKQGATPSSNSAGGTIAYTFIVRNTGNVTLHAVGVSDPKVGPVSCPVSTLAPGVTTTCTKTYTLTQADVDAGTVDNTATATGTPPTGAALTATDSVTTPITRAPSITLDKTAAAPSGSTAGATIAYSFLVTNSGNVTLTTVGVTDPKVGAITCPATTLAPGASTTCTTSYTLTQADVDAGSVINTATARGTSPTAVVVTSTDAVTSTIARTATITMDKQAGTPTGFTVGSTIPYAFIVTNTGNTTLTGLAITDPKVGATACSITTLTPGQVATCTGSYTLTQADVDSGHVANSASATATPPSGLTKPTASDTTDTTLVRTPVITLDKQAGIPSGTTVGSTIAYTFVVTNTGNVTLTTVGVTDTKVGAISCPTATLAPAASTTCTKTYTLTQADVDSGHVANTATATGTPPAGAPVTSTDSTDTGIVAAPAITLDKQAAAPSGNTAGSTIAYSFVVKNTGNVTLHGVAVTDAKVTPVNCPVTTLAPGVTTTCTATYTLTQADVDAGVVNNTASVAGTPPTGAPVTATDTASTPVAASPAISLDKQAATPSGATAGSTIAYAFVVTNTGNVTLHGVAITDAKVGPVNCSVTTLAPGASTTCTKTYTLTQADVDSGHVANTASVAGTPPTGAAVGSTDSTDTLIAAGPTLTLDKTAAAPTGNTAGSTIAYSFLVTNTGNVTLTSVGVTDPKVGPVSCPVATLAPAASTTCTKTYTLTQADVDAGSVVNTATAAGTPPTGAAVTAIDSVTSTIARTATITMDKQAGTPSGLTAGSTIPFAFIVTNTGNTTLTGLVITDPKVGATACSITTLTPGQVATCSGSYTLTQTDVDSGHLANTASATATPPSGLTKPTATDSTDTPITSGPKLTLDKTAAAPTGNTAGSTIAYSFLVTNTGNVTLTSVGVTDPKVGPVSCPVATLAPAASTTCTKTYTLTQADVDAGSVVNTATAAGTPPTGAAVTATDTVTSTIARTATITMDKQAGTPSGSTAGSTIPFAFIVTNTGNTTLTGLSITDPKVGATACSITTLNPGQIATCTGSYTLTQADVDSGHLANTASTTATPPSGLTQPTATDSTDSPITAGPAITLDKTAAAPTGNTAGSTVAYSFLVTNTGNVTLTSVGVTDPKVGPVSCPVASLAPGASTTCTKTYTLTQADVDAGSVVNTATATGTPPTGAAVTSTDTVTSSIARTATITMDKQAGTPSGFTVGSTIPFAFIVTNTGNTTLTALSISDPKVGATACSMTTLTPGQVATCTGSYTLTQADVDSGHLANTATATATPPAGLTAPTATDSTDTGITASPTIALDKTAAAPTGNAAGSTIAYSFLVTNTGNVTLTSVGVADPQVGPVGCPVTTLAPGASTTCTKTYTLTQADVDAGTVINVATASGTPPTGPAVTAIDSVTTPVTSAPAITVDKQAAAPSGSSAGATIAYTFLVKNTGNVTLHAVAVTDAKVGPVTCATTTLAPGATTTCSKTYTLTQADVDSGHVANTASAEGTPPSGSPVSGTDSTDSPITAGPAITLDKTAAAPTGNTAGSTVAYTFGVTNTGNVTLTAVGVSDPKVGPVTCPVATLAPGASTTCTKTYTLTQADVDAGSVVNTATATGTPPTGAAVTATDTVTSTVSSTPGIVVDKQAGIPTGIGVGSTIAYTFIVTNTGNVSLTGIGITDPKVGPVTCPSTALAPGASMTCTRSYALTQGDVDAGHVVNTATVVGTPPTGAAVSGSDSTDSTIANIPEITLDKQAAAPSGNTAGSTIAYTFVVTNSGNVSLTGVALTDTRVGAVTCPATTLAPAATMTCTKSYTLTQADVDAGSVVNTASVAGTPPTGPAVTATDTVTTTVAAAPAITVDKQAAAPTGASAGATIGYTFIVQNTGNVTLHGVAITDPTVGPVTCVTTTLAPGATTTCTKTYTLTQVDVDAGHVANTASVAGTPPSGAAVGGTDSTDSPILAGPSLTLDKTAGTPSGNTAGSTVAYSFAVKNTGNVTLTSVGISDPQVGPVTCAVTTLAPGASTTCTKTYTLTQADVDAGSVVNTATASGTPPTGAAVTAIDTVTTTVTAAPAITLDKQAGTPSGSSAGSTIAYTFAVQNTGNVTLTAVAIGDAKVGPVTCATTTLAPGATTTCSKTYTLTQADVDAGHVANTALVGGTPPTGAPVSATDNTDTPVANTPAITLDKTAGVPSTNAAGGVVAYSFLVTNTGNVTLTSIAVGDSKVAVVSCPVTTLAPGANTTCTASYTLTQADVDAGSVVNTALVAGTPPTGAPVTASDTVTTTVTAAPAITLDKQAAAASGSAAGSTIAYSFVVTNTGNVTLTSVAIGDAKVGPVTCATTTLAPGATTTCTKTYTLTQADVDAGHVANTALVAGTPPTGSPVSATDSTDSPITAGPAITLDKSAAAPTGNTAGSTIAYSFLVTNTGNVTLHAIAIGDATVGTVSCPVTTLAPGENTTCTASYTLTQADVDAGSVVNTALVAGTPPTGAPVTASDTVTTTVTAAPAITLDKQAAAASGSAAGSTIAYSFVVQNTGNVTLHGVAITDATVGPVTCATTTLAPGATTTCSKTYTLTQADVDAGHVANTATVAGTSPTSAVVGATDSTDSPITSGPAITLDKSAAAPSGNTAGSTVAYAFLVTNTGNVTLTAVGVDDPRVGPVSCPVTTLAPGASTTCTKTYTLTQADVDAGSVVNTALVAGTAPTGAAVTDTDTVTTTVTPSPAISLDKQAAAASGSAAGSTIAYSFVVTNTGNVTLHGVAITDATVGPVSCATTTLAPGASTTCTKTYTLTQADVDAGHVANTALVAGTPPTGSPVSATDSTDSPITAGPAITLDKSAAAPTANAAGGTVAYSFLVTNTGNVTLHAIAIGDATVGTVTCPVTTLAPGANTTCTASYTLTQADVDAGSVVNTALVAGTPPTGAPVTATDTVTTTVTAAPAITLDKQAGTPTGSSAGSTIAYTFIVKNTGNVTLSSVTVSDAKVGPVTCPATPLAPGATTTCTTTYVLTQADVDAGHVPNTATASGTPPTGAAATATDSTDTPIPAGPALTLDKTAGTPSGNTAGSTIAYSFLVTNTGNVTLHAVTVSDATAGTVTCPVTTLAPGSSTTCAATYALTQADVDAGTVVNTATASGTPPTGAPVTATDSVTTPVPAAPAITLDKQAGTPSGSSAGSTIAYTFVVTNTGNVTLTSLSIGDAKVGPVTCATTTLAPAATTTCSRTYTLTQADVDAGHVANTALAAGTPPTGPPVTATDDTDSPITAGPAITLTKQAAAPTGNTPGSTIAYTFIVKNTGNVTLTSVAIGDAHVPAVSCPATTLAPDDTMTCTGSYTLTQADVDAGSVVNTALVAGTPPIGDPVTATDTVTSTVIAAPAVTLDKQAAAPTGTSAGASIAYSFVVQNTGNVTLHGLAITDPTVGPVTCVTTTLAPDATTTCTTTYTLTQADVDAGHVANTASVAGTPPTGAAVTASDSTDSPIAAGPAITLDKSAASPSGNTAGSTVTYSFLVTNTGNVTLASVGVTDPQVGPVSCPATSLLPGAATTCTKTYTLTQADVDAGSVVNTATASGTPPTGVAVTATDTVTTTVTASPVITLDKQAAAVTGSSAGATIAYSFVVTNTGNVTLHGVAITDPTVGPVTCPTTTLAPGATTTCSKTYTLTQADVDAGHVANNASVAGTAPTGAGVSATDSTDSPITAGPSITLDKTAAAPSGSTAGSTVVYTFVVRNTGNVTLTGVGVSDPLVDPVTCPVATLAPGASTTCTKTYTLNQADVDAGSIVNTATATGTPPTGAPVTAMDTVTTTVTADPAITLDKQAGAPNGRTAGGTIAYSFVVQNTGNVTLHAVTITDAKVGTVTCPVTSLAPGESTTCTKTYTLTQADVDAGHVANSADATATPPTGAPVTATDTTDTPIAAGPSITLDKAAGAPSGTTAGSSVTYTFVVTNTGNVSLTGVAVDDPRVGPVSCPVASLAPGAATTCTKTYTLTQADVDAGSVVNTATVVGTPPTGAAVTATDTATTTLPANPVIALDKQAAAATGSSAGATIAYSFVVTNTGNVTLHGVAISDVTVGTVTCPTTTLAPGATTTCTTTYTLTQADVDSGHVLNTASVAGTSPAGAVAGATDSTDSPITAGPSITLDKTAGAPSGNRAGATIAYSFLVTNTGNLTLTGVGVTDATVGTVTCPATTLAPSASITCTATYTLSQADVDAGSVVNTATASGTTPTGGAVTATDSITTPVTAAPAISVDKQAGVPTGTAAGATIDYTFIVTNTGNVTLHGVAIADAKVGPVTCATTTLAPSASATCTKTYTLTQADVDAGHVPNSATVSGTPPTGAPVTGTDTTDSPIANVSGITLAKTAGALVDLDANGPDAGDTVPYSFLVTNTGNVSLTSVAVSDAKVGTVTCPAAALAPAASTTCTATYTLTQADVDADVVDNTATASGTPPTGAPVTATDSVEIVVGAPIGVALDKQATTPTSSVAGGRITYSFAVTNTGNVTLDPISVTDPVLGPVTCPATPLAPGATVDCTPINYTLTQADVDAGHKANTATAVGVGRGALTEPAIDSTDTAIVSGPAITLDKVAGTPSGSTAGSTIDYTFLVTNSGNVTLTGIAVTDPKVGAVSCPVVTLAPGESTTCAATYTISQADVDAGTVDNSATAAGASPTGTVVTAGDTTSTGIAAHPALTLDKQAGVPSSNLAGGTIDYTFLVTNTGNVTLDTLFVDDPTVGPVDCPSTPLAVGDTATCTATYALTQDDVDAGHIANVANALGAHGTDWAVPAIDSTDTTLAATPAITLDKQAGTPSGATAGSTIAYTFVVTNTGNVTLTGVGVSDAKVGTVACPAATLAPGEDTTCTATYTLTQADVDAGSVVNTATATGTPPTGAAVTGTDTVTTTIPAAPSITLDKQAGTPSGATAGSTIAYTFVVTNTGNVTLTAVAVVDAKVGTVTCPAATLAPGATTTCTASYTVTQADVDAGHVDNSATASGTPPTGAPVTGGDTTSTGITASPSITLDKQAGTPSGSTAGSTIAYSFAVQNIGNVTLTAVAVSDAKVGTVTCPAVTLAPGATTTCTATYTLTQADVDGGHVANSATVEGTPPTGAPVGAGDSTDTTIIAGASITLDKQAGTPTGTTAGSTIAYTFLVTNTGNVTLTAVGVSDAKVGTVSCPVVLLAPGDDTTCTATYTLTQADVDAGHVDNSATASGTTPTGGTVNGGDTTSTGITASPSITLDKQAGTPSGTTAGSTIAYTFLVTNTGNVTLTAVGVSDAKVGTVTCPATTLAPGGVTTCTASYTLTQADVDAGHVDNSATASGTTPTGGAVNARDTTSTTIAASPAITLDKQAGTPSGTTAGSTIAYTFLVTNTGNVTLTAVAVSDPTVGSVTCPAVTLAPGDDITCTATYTLTQADVDAGHVDNSATATGTPPTGAPVTGGDTTSTTIARTPSIALDKQAGTPTGNIAGSTIAYTFAVTNTGNVTLTAVAVSDPTVGTVTCPAVTLAPGASVTCTAGYALTQADVDAGHFANTATVTGTPPSGADVTANDATDTTISSGPAISLDKVAGVPSGTIAGSTIGYTFIVTNSGNVSLTAVAVSDPKVGTLTCPLDALAPGASTTCTATYTLTQADVDAGVVNNSATATGTPPTGDVVTAGDTTSTPIAAAPALTLDKQAGAPTGNTAGSTIAYTFLVTNEGNVTLNPVSVSDAKVGTVTCPDTALDPAASVTCTATYTLTQADVDAGAVVNTATATGTPPAGDDVTATDTETSPIVANPGIDLVKGGTVNGQHAGDTIDYTFAVTNTGNVTLAGVEVADAKAGTVTCPDTTLAPGASTTCTATYLLTQADVDTGIVHNEATVTGTTPAGDPVTATDAVDLAITPGPSITLDKQAGAPSSAQAGGTIEYTFEVTNSGNVTLAAVAVTDAKVSTVTCPVATLAPGETTTCTARYTLTQADVDAGLVTNTAAVTGTPPTGDPVSDADSVSTPLAQLPALSLDKSADVMAEAVEGDLVNFTFVVTNTGNVTLSGVTLADPLLASLSCPTDTLAPGASMTCTGAPYVITKADVKLGHVTNVADVSTTWCQTAGCVPVDATDTVTVTTAVVEGETDGGGHGGHSGGGLAYTGLSGAPELVALGGGILAAGVLLLLAARRRRKA